jgi:uncharacterized membrane protein (UPF0127 family)
MTAMQKTRPKMLRRPETVRRGLLAACGALLLACATPAPAQSGPLENLDAFPQNDLEISDGKKFHQVMHVWLADTPPRQSQGLMFVRSLPESRGMLFVYAEPKEISMWMKNTFIPLDMVFIDSRHRIMQIVEQTTPHSLDLIKSNGSALAVLEIGAGEAHRLGLRRGQRVTHPALVNH